MTDLQVVELLWPILAMRHVLEHGSDSDDPEATALRNTKGPRRLASAGPSCTIIRGCSNPDQR